MATYVQRIHLNRPINTRLIIAVRFVVTAAVSGASSRAGASAGTHDIVRGPLRSHTWLHHKSRVRIPLAERRPRLVYAGQWRCG